MLVPTQQILKGGSSPSPLGVDNAGDHRSQTARDREKLDAGRKALKELLRGREQQKKKKRTCFGTLRLYITILGGLMLILAAMTFLFLVPMTIDPALATLTFELSHDPVICVTTSFTVTEGLSNTNWCSCLEGCTSDVFTCYQIGVAYKKIETTTQRPKIRKRSIQLQPKVQGETALVNIQSKYQPTAKKINFHPVKRPPESKENIENNYDQNWSNIIAISSGETSNQLYRSNYSENLNNEISRDPSFVEYVAPGNDQLDEFDEDFPLDDFSNFISDDPVDYDSGDGRSDRSKRAAVFDTSEWDVTNASLFVNIKGCGYPPDVNCSIFEMKYSKVGRRYYCHYSRVNNSIVLDTYDRTAAITELYYSFGLSFGFIVLGAALIILMNFPYKKTYKKFKRRRIAQAPR